MMTIEQAKSELMQMYGALSSNKQMAIDVLVKIQPCEDAISRQAVRDTIFEECSGIKLDIDFAKVLLLQRAIKALHPVTPQPKIGHWIWQTEDIYRCSECGEDIHVKEVMNVPQYVLCPICGTRMEPQKD